MKITALQLISDALVEINALASLGATDEAPVGSEQTDGLRSLNKLINQWSAIDIDLVQLVVVAIAMAGPGPYSTARPVKIRSAFCRTPQISAPVQVCSAEQWSQIVDESRAGQFCTKLFCDYAYPDSHLYVWPSATGSTLNVIVFLPLVEFATLATELDLPPGYARAFTLGLAVDLAEQYGKPITESLMGRAQQARADLAAANQRIFGPESMPAQPLPQSPAAQRPTA